jgi:hypothetical protein
MRQLVKADQRDLRALPVVDRGVELQMRELDLAGPWPAPVVRRKNTAVKPGTRLT